MGCLQSKSKAEGGAESTSGLPPLPGADGSPESAVSETGTIAERAESLAKRWCACEAMMLQPRMEPERGEIEPELGVGAGDKLESHAGMLSMPRGKHGKAKVIGVNNQAPTKEAARQARGSHLRSRGPTAQASAKLQGDVKRAAGRPHGEDVQDRRGHRGPRRRHRQIGRRD